MMALLWLFGWCLPTQKLLPLPFPTILLTLTTRAEDVLGPGNSLNLLSPFRLPSIICSDGSTETTRAQVSHGLIDPEAVAVQKLNTLVASCDFGGRNGLGGNY